MNIPIWPGSSSFDPKTQPTPYGYYDDDYDFQVAADQFARFAAQNLGYPIVDVELQDINFYNALERATTVYGNEVYAFKIRDNQLSIEGGDINIFNHKIICIGISQRTSLDSIKAILPLIFKNNFKYVYAIDIPKKRQFMHLDCVFTKLDVNECLVYPPLFIDQLIDYKIFKFDYKNNYHCYKSSEKNLKELFEDDGYTLNFLNCGGDKKQNQDSELLKMGANVFTLSPGVVAGYYRNKETLKVFKNNNYNIISIDTYLKMQELNENEKYFIYLDENELSKGHGGIRCLTFPIERDIINE